MSHILDCRETMQHSKCMILSLEKLAKRGKNVTSQMHKFPYSLPIMVCQVQLALKFTYNSFQRTTLTHKLGQTDLVSGV